MKISIQVWLGKQPARRHHHPSKSIVTAKTDSPNMIFCEDLLEIEAVHRYYGGCNDNSSKLYLFKDEYNKGVRKIREKNVQQFRHIIVHNGPPSSAEVMSLSKEDPVGEYTSQALRFLFKNISRISRLTSATTITLRGRREKRHFMFDSLYLYQRVCMVVCKKFTSYTRIAPCNFDP